MKKAKKPKVIASMIKEKHLEKKVTKEKNKA